MLIVAFSGNFWINQIQNSSVQIQENERLDISAAKRAISEKSNLGAEDIGFPGVLKK